MGGNALAFGGVARKKTKFQLHQEKEAEKKKRADLEAAAVYDDFVAEFGGEADRRKPTAFVTGGSIQPGSRPSSATPAKKPGSKYVPSFLPPSMAAAMAATKVEAAPVPGPQETVFPLPQSIHGGAARKPRNIDLMLENLKREQEEREERQRVRQALGIADEPDPLDPHLSSLDENDPFTTNLYVGNLAPDVDEEVLKREFGRFGPIASVKIMWPRDEEQRRRARNSGFVAFMSRGAAARAKEELNGVLLHQQELKLGWGKAVAMPTNPLFAGTAAASVPTKAGVTVPPPGVEAPLPWVDPHATQDRRMGREEHQGTGPDIEVVPPADDRLRFVIDTTAAYVLRDGPDFEQVLMERESANPEFAFMFNLQAPEHMYFRWRLYSLAQGDTQRAWRVEPFVLLEGGQRWLPPPMTLPTGGSHQTAAQRGGELRDKDTPLSDLQRDKFEDLLRGLTAERAAVRDAMVFALDHADCAAEVVDILTEALTLDETPIPTKVARLFLASDILHNSTAPVRNASRYRARLEDALPAIFESMQQTYRSAPGRMAQEGLRRHVLRVLRVWRDWFIFGDDILNGLQATFLRGGAASDVPDNPELRGELEALSPEELETRCRRSGLSRRGTAADQVTRLLTLHAYLNGDLKPTPRQKPQPADPEAAGAVADTAADGTAMEVETADGDAAPPAAAKPEPPQKAKPLEPVSRWTAMDDDDEAAGGVPAASTVLPHSPARSDDIFSDDSPPPAAASEPAATPRAAAAAADAAAGTQASAIPGLERSPSAEPPLPQAKPDGEAARPDFRGGAQPVDAAEEARPARARQVEVAVEEYRDELEEAGGLSRQQVEDRVRVKRAQLTVEAERAAERGAGPAAGAAKDDGKSSSRRGSSRDRDRERTSRRGRSRDASKERSRERDRSRGDRDRDRDRSRDRGRSKSTRDRSRSRSRGRRSPARPRRRSRSRSRDRGRQKDARRTRSRSPKRRR